MFQLSSFPFAVGCYSLSLSPRSSSVFLHRRSRRRRSTVAFHIGLSSPPFDVGAGFVGSQSNPLVSGLNLVLPRRHCGYRISIEFGH
ncbi:unnamed protein product [Citrullus colocynthis]|uniref:Uncharacterized protein n=1 Tax=Citrullus colocynthis TaxID=252529 RepID=A0ABP0YKJ5_9ROSI